MDAAFLNFHKEEDFSSYFSSYEEDSQSYDGINTNAPDYHWLDYERELNGDMGLIPMPSENNFTLSTSPPIKEDYNKIMSDWNNLVSLEVNDVLVDDMANATAASLNLSASVVLPNPDEDMLDIKEEDFDITKYVVGSESSTPEKMFSAFVENGYSLSSPKQIDNVINHERDTKSFIMIKEEPIVADEEENEEDSFKDHTLEIPFIKLEKTSTKRSRPTAIPQQKFGGKRIDMARGRYMFDEEETSGDSDDEDIAVDVETIEGETNPVLQAGDLDSLLEQFEATETTNMQLHQQRTPLTPERDDQPCVKTENDISLDIIVEQVKLISPIKSPVVTTKKAKRYLLDFRDPRPQDIIPTNPLVTMVKAEKLDSQIPISEPIKLPKNPKTITVEATSPKPSTLHARNPKLASPQTPVKDQRKNKQILEALPTELIDRIRASSKRKPVPVIEPIAPTKRRMLNTTPPKVRDPITNSTLANRIINSAANSMTIALPLNNNKVSTTTSLSDTKTIMLDHDYCTYSLSNVDAHYANKDGTNSAKDSGFSSAEEDEKSIITAQPTIKGSNGRLMVSLLKTNTIKKKLNLEEYKKRLQSRPNASDGTFPADVADDENARRLKHQEMLMKMAKDHLEQGANSQYAGKDDVITLPTIQIPQVGTATTTKISIKSTKNNSKVVIKTEQDTVEKVVEVKKKPPKNIVMKTLVSVGTNTEESWGHLEQILDNARIKISPNSLISSIVEQLPKPKVVDSSEQIEHGEDKTILYIDKTQPKKLTRGVLVQTLHSSSHLLRQRRRRTSLSSCSSSRSSSSSSTSSYSDSDSSRSSGSRSRGERGSRSRSRSRSRHTNSRTPSPVRRKRQEVMSEVEERRRVYVGRIADGTTKDDLRRRFARFGPITNLSVHFRRHADNYGFVTFLHKEDAYEAVERGNENADDAQYDLSFGGRRLFCLSTYSDLDNMPDDTVYADYCPWPQQGMVGIETSLAKDETSFDDLLRRAQAKLRNRKI